MAAGAGRRRLATSEGGAGRAQQAHWAALATVRAQAGAQALPNGGARLEGEGDDAAAAREADRHLAEGWQAAGSGRTGARRGGREARRPHLVEAKAAAHAARQPVAATAGAWARPRLAQWTHTHTQKKCAFVKGKSYT